MEKKGLIFIPDISGFTRFIGEMEISHSKLIVQELLETLIKANKIGLKISEIEGDAILFYKFSSTPNLEEIYRQVEKMFVEFHKQLIAYDHRRFCQCKACMSAINLSLKVITHYGEFTGYNVHNFNKLIGKDIIIAHRLLKNDIPHNEYWLVTNEMLPDNTSNTSPSDFAEWMKWNKSVKQTEIGEIPFYYTQLGPLKDGVTAEAIPVQEISDKVKVLSVTRDYQTDIITLFHATGDYNYRARWQDGVKAIEEVNHFLPRVGMKCRYILENGEEVIYATSYSFSPERIEFSESDDKKKKTIYYLLEKINDNTTRLTIDYYLQDNLTSITIFRLSKKKKIEQSFNKSFENLEKVVKEIRLPQTETKL